MSMPILATKLYIPPPLSKAVLRPRLINQLQQGLASGRKLSLISAPAGFGKTTLISEWVAACERPVAWLSLDEGENDPTRFLTYLIAALQTLVPNIGQEVLAVLLAPGPQPPSVESILTNLLNEIAAIPDDFILILDDYHVIDAQPVNQALTFLLEHRPPQIHLVIATRENPPLPLARYRARNQLSELRAADLRFTLAEVAEFLNQVMGLNLSSKDIAALENRTEGWIAGLQLAAISIQSQTDITDFIQSFTGSHYFVLDYLLEEVLQQQPANVQTFLLRTAILNRLCGPLCDAVCFGYAETPSSSSGPTDPCRSADHRLVPATSGQETLEYLERANLFIVPLDNERRWYRYHHLFAELLRQRLQQSVGSSPEDNLAELHTRASQWYQQNDLLLEAFHHAAAANDVERAERLIAEEGMPLHLRGALNTILDWLGSLPTAVLDARPSLWVRHATLSLVGGQTTGVEEKLQAAEAALGDAEMDDKTRNLVGQIAAARATLALTRYQPENIISQAHRALEYLSPNSLTFRFTAFWTLGFAYYLLGDRAKAIQAYSEAISIGQASGDMFSTLLASSSLAEIQELENQLYAAAETYRWLLKLHGDHPHPNAGEDYLGLARILYEWNDLEAAEQHGQRAVQLTRRYDSVIDRFVICDVFLARLKLAQGDVNSAAAIVSEADQIVRQNNFVHRMPEVAAAQVLVLLQQNHLEAAGEVATKHNLPQSQVRVHLARGDTSTALAILEPLRQQMEVKNWQDELLKVTVLQAVALFLHGEEEQALQALDQALELAQPGGFVRIFVNEGTPMAKLLAEAAAQGIKPDYVATLLAAFDSQAPGKKDHPRSQPLIEPLSERELEVLGLVAQGLSNREISQRLFIALDTVKGHNRRIYGKLQVNRRTEAVARARELGLL